MSTTVIQKGQQGSKAFFADSFLLHKLHSLSGIFPIGFFMIQHLIANSYSLRGETAFNTVVAVFGYLPFVAVMEWGIVFLPLIFHSIYGFMIMSEMQGPGGNIAHYGYTRNWLYWLQRWTGVIAFAYIAYHVYDTWGIKRVLEFTQSHEAGFRAISYDAMMWRFNSIGYTLIYVIGITAASFHLANGLFNFGIRWGITIGREAQKISAALWSFVGIALTVIGIWTAVNFHVLSVQPQDKFGGVTVREKFPNLDDLIKGDVAPADPTPLSKPDAAPPVAPMSAPSAPSAPSGQVGP